MSLVELLFFNRYMVRLDNFMMKHQRIGLTVCFIVLWCLIAAVMVVLFSGTAAVESGTTYNRLLNGGVFLCNLLTL